jgi:hypothetical protein
MRSWISQDRPFESLPLYHIILPGTWALPKTEELTLTLLPTNGNEPAAALHLAVLDRDLVGREDRVCVLRMCHFPLVCFTGLSRSRGWSG